MKFEILNTIPKSKPTDCFEIMFLVLTIMNTYLLLLVIYVPCFNVRIIICLLDRKLFIVINIVSSFLQNTHKFCWDFEKFGNFSLFLWASTYVVDLSLSFSLYFFLTTFQKLGVCRSNYFPVAVSQDKLLCGEVTELHHSLYMLSSFKLFSDFQNVKYSL